MGVPFLGFNVAYIPNLSLLQSIFILLIWTNLNSNWFQFSFRFNSRLQSISSSGGEFSFNLNKKKTFSAAKINYKASIPNLSFLDSLLITILGVGGW